MKNQQFKDLPNYFQVEGTNAWGWYTLRAFLCISFVAFGRPALDNETKECCGRNYSERVIIWISRWLIFDGNFSYHETCFLYRTLKGTITILAPVGCVVINFLQTFTSRSEIELHNSRVMSKKANKIAMKIILLLRVWPRSIDWVFAVDLQDTLIENKWNNL